MKVVVLCFYNAILQLLSLHSHREINDLIVMHPVSVCSKEK